MCEIQLDEKGRYKIKSKDCKINKKDDTLYLFESSEYWIVLDEDSNNVKVRIGDHNIDKGLNFKNFKIIKTEIRNYIGKTEIRIFKDNKKVPLKFRSVMILSEKIPRIYEEDVKSINIDKIINLHDEFCKKMIDSITEKYLHLPFSISAPTSFEYIEAEEPINELFAYHFLKNNKDRIISAYENILKFAHKKLVDEPNWVDFWEVTSVDGDTILGIAHFPKYLIKVSSELGVVEVGKKHYAPVKVLQRNKYETFDTLENRFAKHFLAELINWCERVLKTLGDKMDEKNRGGLNELYTTLEHFWNNPIFSEVGEFTMFFPYTSQVLLKREGYRDLLELWKVFKAYLPFFGELERAIANKDIAKLYEYWCFFKLVEELEKIFGKKELKVVVEPTGKLSEGQIYVKFENKWKLYYNKLFKRGSYSIPLKPDFSLFDRNGLVGVFDAKFKLDIADESGLEDNEEFETMAKLEDIYKMHTYRDALKARFAVVLYPGKNSLFFKVDKSNNEGDDFSLMDLMDRESIRLDGVGYLGFKPE